MRLSHRVLFVIIAGACALAVAASTARAQDLPAQSRSLDLMENVTHIEPERPRNLRMFGYERAGDERLLTVGDLEFGYRREPDETPDGRRTRFDRIYLSNGEHDRFRWTFWHSGDRQDSHDGTRYKSGGISLSIAY